MLISVVIPTHNPDPKRLRLTVDALSNQSAIGVSWDLVIVDNASTTPVEISTDVNLNGKVRIIRETKLGLTSARRAGVAASEGEIIVFVDDDNVLAPDYLETVVRTFASRAQVGAIGGKSLPEFESPPEKWTEEFFPLLALRDLGEHEQIFAATGNPTEIRSYPSFAPVGAGLALRRVALAPWLADSSQPILDRVGKELSSGGDNQIVLSVLRAGWAVAYIPSLVLIHLIPATRLDHHYLARLNYSIQKSWMQVLTLNRINSWPPLSPWAIRLRKLKAWFMHRAWHSPAAYIRWRGICGHFEGRVR